MDNVEARDGDEELALFLEMRRREKDHGFSSLAESGPYDARTTNTKSILAITTNSVQLRRSETEKFLDSENNKQCSDYEWLLAAPETLAEIEVHENFMVKRKEPKARSTALKPRVENILQEPVRECIKVYKPIPKFNSSTAVSKQGNIAADLKSRSKPSRQITPTSGNKIPSTKINSARLSAQQYATPDTRTSSTRSNPRASALTRSSSVGKSVLGHKSTAPTIPEIRTRPVSASRSRVCSSGAHSRSGDRSTGRSKNSNDMNPVLLGTQMVERVVNMRRLPPPKLDDNINSTGKSSGLGFGRTLSRSSLDMALRHMNIRRSISGNLRVTSNDKTNS